VGVELCVGGCRFESARFDGLRPRIAVWYRMIDATDAEAQPLERDLFRATVMRVAGTVEESSWQGKQRSTPLQARRVAGRFSVRIISAASNRSAIALFATRGRRQRCELWRGGVG